MPITPDPPSTTVEPSGASGWATPQVPLQPSAGPWSPAAIAQAVPDHALVSPWLRLGASLLNGVLVVVTLGIGYLIWTLVLWGQGQNPGKKICGLRVVKADTGRVATFGDMLVRNFVFGGIVLGFLGGITVGILYLVDALMIFGGRRQRLIDKMAGTLVVRA
jgi:uncharacterized RDD family membrane protein YckC